METTEQMNVGELPKLLAPEEARLREREMRADEIRSRLLLFSDGIFAIAMTLLVLDVHLTLKADHEWPPASDLLMNLKRMGPHYFAFVLSFLVIGVFWAGHCRRFSHVRRTTRALLVLNILFLMTVALLPFPTSVISHYESSVSKMFYATSMAMVGVFDLVLWIYAFWGSRVITGPEMTNQKKWQEFCPLLAMPVMFAVSIPLAACNLNWTYWAWAAAAPLEFTVRHLMRRNGTTVGAIDTMD